ncbi:MAG TPA: UbiA-like polyprenyltransferase [Candidatus Polarisedimenticolaceae bacterium]|nr:UbiA-like polyprenyltransferase [Candidatus Polarisedimenticolaceae bacterium]
MRAALATVRTWGTLVKFSHSVFALPFAFVGAALAAVGHPVTLRQVVWIAVAMVGARNAAMGFNRLADHAIDARNPRTAGRELPAGRLTRAAVWTATLLLTVIFVGASFALNPLCGALSPLALLIVFGYSYTKRFTWGSHFVLGLSLAIAPVGAWVAVRGSFAGPDAFVPWLLAACVLLWVAGFDVVYACQDVDFDRAQGLHSVPARLGIPRALLLARTLHGGAVAAMAGVGLAAGLGGVYWVGLLGIAGLLAWEHRLLRPGDLSRLGLAFFNLNGIVSVAYLGLVLASLWSAR